MGLLDGSFPRNEDETREEEMRQRGRAAFDAGRFDEAYNLFQGSALDEALRWLREEGITFARPKAEITPLELVVGLADAGRRVLVQQGDEASIKVSAACWLFGAVAELRLSLEETVAPTKEAVGMKLAEMVSRGIMIGQIDMVMHSVRHGWFDKLAEFEVLREQRRAGAKVVNERKKTVRDKALAEAIAIAGRNGRLSHEDLAVRVRESLSLATSIKTMTGWVRGWRRQGWVPAQTL